LWQIYIFFTDTLVNWTITPEDSHAGLSIRLLEGIFVLGAMGSVLVFVLTAIDDVRELFSRDDTKIRGTTSKSSPQ